MELRHNQTQTNKMLN
nr:photosystem II protein L [Cordia dichotoma]